MVNVIIINQNTNNLKEFKILSNSININNIDKILNNNNSTNKIYTWTYNNINIILYGIKNYISDFNINLYQFPLPIDKIYGNCMFIATDNNNNNIDLTIELYNNFYKSLFNLDICVNNIKTPPTDLTEFSISFDDNKLAYFDEKYYNISITNNEDDNDIDKHILENYDNLSDLVLSDEETNIIDNQELFELTFSDDDDDNGNNNDNNILNSDCNIKIL